MKRVKHKSQMCWLLRLLVNRIYFILRSSQQSNCRAKTREIHKLKILIQILDDFLFLRFYLIFINVAITLMHTSLSLIMKSALNVSPFSDKFTIHWCMSVCNRDNNYTQTDVMEPWIWLLPHFT